jgi:perosamine synthetase
MFCPQKPFLSPFQLISALLCRRYDLNDRWLQFKGRDLILTYQGRTAINLACRLLNIGTADHVLMPSYNCGSEVDPIWQTGARIEMYRVDERCRIDFDDIMRRTTFQTRIIYITHYFGWLHDLSEIRKWCSDRGIILFEDCALSLFSSGSNGYCGTYGDVSVFSFPKWLPTTYGGALTMKTGSLYKYKYVDLRTPSKRVDLVDILRIIKRWCLGNRFMIHRKIMINLTGKGNSSSSQIHVQNGKGCSVEMPKNYYFDSSNGSLSISGVSKRIAEVSSIENLISRRRHNYMKLHERVQKQKLVTPLFHDLPEGVCPLSFPIVVGNRRNWINAMRNMGVSVGPWWGGHHGRLSWEEFPEAQRLKNEILALPIHQNLEDSQIDYIGDCLSLIAK